MGLMHTSAPVKYSPETDTEDPVPLMHVLQAIDTMWSVKLYYAYGDTKDKLSELLDAEGINEELKNAILKSIGFTVSTGQGPSELSHHLPGVDLVVKHPERDKKDTIWSIIIDLNDHFKWKREAIADWIENVADIKDIAFPTPEVKDEVGQVSQFTRVVKIQRILSY